MYTERAKSPQDKINQSWKQEMAIPSSSAQTRVCQPVHSAILITLLYDKQALGGANNSRCLVAFYLFLPLKMVTLYNKAH